MRPITAEWEAVTPAMRRLDVKAGAAPAAQCMQLGELPVGSAVITAAGDLAAQFMIHVIVRAVDEPVTASGVRRGLQNGLRRLSEWGVRHVALVPLGTGAGNLDAEEAAAIMVPALVEHMAANEVLTQADIHVESDYEFDVFDRQIRICVPDSDRTNDE
ncbi:hypothetical protein BH23GEM10_BH23GEM10_18300 [soil metagenome]